MRATSTDPTDEGVTDEGVTGDYVHGYSRREARRLADQANVLAPLLHAGTAYPPGSRVLEAGCGVGAQTAHLVAGSPGAHVTSVDVSASSLALARERVPDAGVEWRQADVYELPFADASFDHVFVCFLLEHLKDPQRALAELLRVLRGGGTLTAVEGDHGSTFFHPDGARARAAIDCQVRLQAAGGGNALIGRELQPLLTTAGYQDVVVEPRTVYADQTRPELVAGFTRDTFIAAIEGVREDALAAGFTTAADFDHGIEELRRSARAGGTFHYTYLKAHAVKPGGGAR